MKHCCENKSEELDKLRAKQGKVLKIVLFINAAMFVIEMAGGIFSRSSALTADSLDMLGDAVVYGFSFYVLNKDIIWRARASLLKGLIMAAFGVGILVQVALHIINATVPAHETMSIIGFFALIANAICLYLLYTHKEDDINMRSTWICSRNDIVANVSVLFASLLVAKTVSGWPDVIVGAAISILFLSSALEIVKDSLSLISNSGEEQYGKS